MTEAVAILSDTLSPFNHTSPAPQVEVGKLENPFVDLPPFSPTPHTHNSSASFDYEYDVHDDVFSPRPPSFGSFGPPNCEFLCSPILNMSFNVQEDRVFDGVDVPQKNCDIIYDDYVWESTSEQESAMKVNFSTSAPLPHYPHVFHDFLIPTDSLEKLF